jgi:hypothetical protein
MNKPWVLQQLKQAHHNLGEIIREVEADTDEDDGFPIFYAQLPFVYRHLNCAWNTKLATDAEIAEAFKTKKSESAEWKGFPRELEPFIHD